MKTELKMTVEVKSQDGTVKSYDLVGVVDMPPEEFAKEINKQQETE